MIKKMLVLLLSLTVLNACSSVFKKEEVKPWQRGILSQEGMQLITDGMENYVDEHIYFSKEASKGGIGVGGGGCGCN